MIPPLTARSGQIDLSVGRKGPTRDIMGTDAM